MSIGRRGSSGCRVCRIVGIRRRGRRHPAVVPALDIPRPGPETDHVLPHDLALLVPLLSHFGLGPHLVTAVHELLQLAQTHRHEHLGLVVAHVGRVGRVEDQLVHPDRRGFQFHDFIVEQGGLDVLGIHVFAVTSAFQDHVEFVYEEYCCFKPCPLVSDQ